MKEILKRGATSNILRVFLADSASTTGAGKTGLTNTSTGLIISTIADNEATATTYTAAASNTETITTLGTYAAPSSGKARFKEVDATNFPGIYEIQIADARFNVSNATQLLVSIQCTGVAPTFAEVQLVTVDLYDTVRFGLTALPNVASGSAGAIITSGTGTAQLNVASGNVTVGTNNDKTGYSLATAPPTSADIADAVWDEALSGHLASGSTGNALNAAGSAGDPWSTALPGAYGAGTAGKIVGDNLNATVSSRLASSAITLSSGAVTVGTNNDKTGYSLSSSQTFNVTGNITGNLSGSVGSVTGAVGSVTNAVTVGTINSNVITAASISSDAGAEIADAVWDEATSGHTTAGTYGGRVLRAANSNVEVQVTGSNHVAADVHEFQAGVITAADFAAGAIDANAIAANAIGASEIASDAIVEIAQGVLTEATSTNTGVYAAGDVGNILGRLHNMIEADGANFRYTANALEEAPSGGGGGGSTTVRMGPFTVVAEGQGSDETLDINKAATHGIDCKLVDAFGTGIDLTGATVDVYIYSSSGALVTSVSATGTYEAGGDITWTIPTTVTNTAGTYTAVIRRETSATDVQYFGPLRILVRDN